jgi:tetratricopeptide (TPR) repeat protein
MFEWNRAITPLLSNAHKNLALSYQALGDLKNAVELFIQSTQADAADPRSLYHREELLENNPELVVEIPDLQERLLMCRAAVDAARSKQPEETLH